MAMGVDRLKNNDDDDCMSCALTLAQSLAHSLTHSLSMLILYLYNFSIPLLQHSQSRQPAQRACLQRTTTASSGASRSTRTASPTCGRSNQRWRSRASLTRKTPSRSSLRLAAWGLPRLLPPSFSLICPILINSKHCACVRTTKERDVGREWSW
jgi:hypothetical protein